jgi:hypothetical protein
MVPESQLEKTEHGLVSKGEGWFVLNKRDAVWRHVDGRGASASLAPISKASGNSSSSASIRSCSGSGRTDGHVPLEGRSGGLPRGVGEAVLIIEGEERQLRAWDFVHCPPNTKRVIGGAGSGPCFVIAVGAREHDSLCVTGVVYVIKSIRIRARGGISAGAASLTTPV